MTRQADVKNPSIVRIDPAGAEAVIVASWVVAACPNLRLEKVDAEVVHFRWDDATGDRESALRRLLTEDRFRGWTVAVETGDTPPDTHPTCATVKPFAADAPFYPKTR